LSEKPKVELSQDVSPFDEKNQYSDIFWASMYGTLCRFGLNETRLVWMRASAFLIVHGVLLQSALDPQNSDLLSAYALQVAGLVLACLWSIMNYLGWMNQDRWYWYAAMFKFEKIQVPLPTDYFRGSQPQKPGGHIYVITQIVVWLFVLLYAGLIGLTCYQQGFSWVIALILSGASIGLVWIVTYFTQQWLWNHRSSPEDDPR